MNMDDLTADQHMETNLEFMKFCTYVINKEMKRFNLDLTVYQSFLGQLPGTLDVNFDIAYNRCAFMYKYTLCNMYFFGDCMKKFLLECAEFKNLVSKWTADSNVRLCSLTCGPGLDYLSFMLALSNHFLSTPSFKNVTLLSKHGAWRNTVGIVADALEEGALSKYGIGQLLNFKNIEVVQTDLFISIPMKGFEALEQSNVILMVKTLNLTEISPNQEIIKIQFMELISSLKPETTIFFIDTKPSLTLFFEVLSKFPGKFLYKPEHFSFRVPITFSDDYKEKHGSFPVIHARGAFFVWQKLSFEARANFSTLNPRTDIKEVSRKSIEKTYNEDYEVLNITKTLKDIIFQDKNLESNTAGNVIRNIKHEMKESVSTTSNPYDSSKQLEMSKSTSTQSLFTNQSVPGEISQVNFPNRSCSPHLKKSTSIDNCFFQSSKNISLLGKGDLLQNYPLNTWRNEETYPTSSPQHKNVTKNKTSENKEINNTPKSNQAIKSTSESKATQTEFDHSITNSSLVKDLTERVRRLVSSLENEIQKNISDGQTNYQTPNRSIYSSCLTNDGNNPDVDINLPCCSCYQCGKKPVNCCNYEQTNHIHCCAARHMIHRCEMHCKACIYRCCIHNYKPYENNVASASTSSAQPQIVIPLQNVSNDILLQIISAAKSSSKPQ